MLQVDGLEAFYGSSPAVTGVGFAVEPGQAVCLLGRNGMGKTTTLKAVLGLVRSQAKALTWQNFDLRPLRPEKRARLGIGYMPQEHRVFPELTVLENLRLGGGNDVEYFDKLIEKFPQLKSRLQHPAGVLSGGEQQMLGAVRALWPQPGLLLLDEPSEGVMPTLVATMERLLKDFCSRGGAILIAEQNVTWVRSWCAVAVILERGKSVFQGPMEALSEAMLRKHLSVF